MKNTTLGILTLGILFLIGSFVFFSGAKPFTSDITGSVVGSAQDIIISAQGLRYTPEAITVKAGQPVRITLDRSVQGCLRSLSIPAFGVNKYLPKPTDSVTFTPTKPGTYPFSCSMGMGSGKIIVE